jgi:hypothetical protein
METYRSCFLRWDRKLMCLHILATLCY